MRITILCSSPAHPINSHLRSWIHKHQGRHKVDLVRSKSDLGGGDLLLLISCSEIMTESDRSSYAKTVVIHASDLPIGRGWSPHIWQIIGGATEITVTLLSAENEVDSGAIWKKVKVNIPKDALWDEINQALFEAELDLMDFAIENCDVIKPTPQSAVIQATFFAKRTPANSRIDPGRSIQEQFDLIRICDPDRFPAYFELHGHKYFIRLEKSNG
jgi:methionyl-tRNA formyltransferase